VGRNINEKIFADPGTPARTDLYPGHEGYLFIVNEILDSVAANKITFPGGWLTKSDKTVAGGQVTGVIGEKAESTTRRKHNDVEGDKVQFYELTVENLAASLVARFFNDYRPPTAQSNWEWCDPDGVIDRGELAKRVTNALRQPNGFPSQSNPSVNPNGFRDDSWETWAGMHWGIWMADDEHNYLDTASWAHTIQRPSQDPDDTLDSTTGLPRVYDHQHVVWRERERIDAVDPENPDAHNFSHHGWNQSHPDVPYLWGWDPKDFPQTLIKYPGHWGVHVGFPFLYNEVEDIRFIVWLTPTEVFLETVNLSREVTFDIDPTNTRAYKTNTAWKSKTIVPMIVTPKTGAPKASTALNGRGQWVIQKVS
jgi:hypothetical protein